MTRAAPAAQHRLGVAPETFRRADGRPVGWRIFEGLVPYEEAVAEMETCAEAVAAGRTGEQVWLLEHPALYTAGTSAAALPESAALPVHRTGRGGQITYHGPGQRVAYVMLDLQARRPDVRAFVAALEHWIVATLAHFTIRGERREDRVGVWVARPDKPRGLAGELAEDKIAAIGIRVRRWTSFHGISLNVEPDLAPYRAIVPCGIADMHLGVTSLADLGLPVTTMDADVALRRAFEDVFGPTRDLSA